MRFIKAYIDGYGKFHNLDFVFEPGFNLFFGPNEAGKTTLMSFLRTIFFGFPGKKNAFDRYEPLAGGVHGGTLEVETTDKKKYSVSIKPGRTLTGEIIILHGDGTEFSGESARKRLQIDLHGISENIYKTVFAFSLTELQRLDSLENDEINAHIYSAGTGVGEATLPDILKTVEEKKIKIYKPGGKVQLITKITKELERIRSEISEIKNDQERYKSAIVESDILRQEHIKLSHTINNKRREKERASKLKAGRDNANELNEIEKQISALPVVKEEFPADGAERLDKLEEKLAEKREGMQECVNQISNLRFQTSPIIIDNKILDAEASIMSLTEGRSAEVENVRKIEEVELSLTSLKTNLVDAISEIGTNWNEDRVIGIDVGEETLQNIRVLTEDISIAQVNVEKAENTLAQAKKNTEESTRELQIFSHKLEKNRIIQLRFVLIFGILISTGLGVFCWITFKPVSGIMAGVLGIMFIVAFYYVYYKSAKDTLNESQKQLSDFLESGRLSIDKADKELSKARGKYQDAFKRWYNWLEDNGFRTELDRNGIFTLIESIKRVKELIRKKEEVQKELQHLKKRAHACLDRVNSALLSCRLRTIISENDISSSINLLENALKKQKELKIKKERLAEKTAELEARKQTLDGIIRDIEINIQNMIIEGGVSNTGEFRKHSHIVQERTRLRERKNFLETQLIRLIGNTPDVRRFRDEVTAESDPIMTDRSIDELEEEITQLEKKRSNIMQDMGAKMNQIAELERSEKLGGLRLEEESLKARLQDAFSEWSVNALCHKLLQISMEIYEKERQPSVLKYAGSYLDKITQGRYVRVVKKADGNKLVVETPEGLQKNVATLSRGTAEQLYLSMRLAFIKEYANRVGTIPLIVDDILVNFDPQRAKSTIRLLSEISQENQIIMFTCHPSTLDLCKSEIKDFKEPNMIIV